MKAIKVGFVAACCLCFCTSEVVLGSLDGDSGGHLGHASLILEQEGIRLFQDSKDSSSNSSCDCGGHSVSCDLKNGVKICDCEPGYAPGEYQNCAPICNSTQKCNNGGSCFNSVCVCLPGTSGPYCDAIGGCSELSCDKDKNANCSYDQKNFKAFCECKQQGYEFDYEDSACKECNCEECGPGKMCFSTARKCEFVQGRKTCTCSSLLHQFNPNSSRCSYCSASKHALSCSFDPNGEIDLVCERDYSQRFSSCGECLCSSYNLFSSCKFRKYEKVCTCDKGYSEHIGYCRSCDCGNGKCEFDGNYRKTGCLCDPGYVDDAGKCREDKTCYCGENAACKQDEKGVKKCDCPSGYQEVNGLCADINECEDPQTCDSSMKCINYDGGYECACREGFQKSKKEPGKCEDINECLKQSACPDANTECLNTVGSYKCYCKQGFVTRADEDSPVLCESNSGWKLGYGLLIGVFVVVIGILMLMIYKYR